MTQFLYTSAYVMRRAGRRSPTAGVQLHRYLPSPDGVMVSDRAAAGWTLEEWRKLAETRSPQLRADLLALIDVLAQEQSELRERYEQHW
jgi:hypothetical protein